MLNGASLLDRDLGLGSLERVELLARLETAFGVRLPDQIVAEANTPEDLAKALVATPGTEVLEDEAASALRAAITTQKLHRAARDAGVFSSETLLDVLRYRAMHDAERTHLLINEETDGKERSVTLTFGELYASAQRLAAELARRGVPGGGRGSSHLRPLFFFPMRKSCWRAPFPCRSPRRSARIASRSMRRGSRR